ncbi:ribbon-helix-helix protein, CopG family [Deinococcus psychrotolerans]|uniref:Ribbon-helix-helix protein, CopG family n=1 Tax=Deinococcus psychrotolerans TaxID=2489213 RepID=A0A3G8Y988_9DEIO|nr:ribbon-helix-helix domain-containing protein [Deinococcus psychrotolerans]AZI41463.1 ribbon-helix-helix protein, CopG family [Deinococcus psychrotolerans]
MTYETAQRVTVSLPSNLATYLDEYQKSHKLSSRSEAVAQAIEALREKQLAEEYAEYARSGEFVDLENGDGLDSGEDDRLWK